MSAPAQFTDRYSVALKAIRERRAAAGVCKAGVAAYSESDFFKGPQDGKPKAKRWNHLLSTESKHREPCTLKQAAKHLKNPGIISLGGGLPSSEYFPFSEISYKVNMPENDDFSFSEFGKNATTSIGKRDMANGAEYDLSVALNYTQATGGYQMMRWVTEHTELLYNPPYADWACSLSIGSTGALEMALRMFCEDARGDTVVTEEYAFATALETISPLGVATVGSKVDGEGLLADALDELLTNWDEKAHGSRKPHVLYTVPSGQNPTGSTQGAQRRKEIYAVCQKHDIFIIEDEPYYFLQMPAYKTPAERAANPTAPEPWNIDKFLSSLVPTFVSIDVDGRVLRMDSFSKVLSPGSRMGWITASEQIIERYVRHSEVASQGPAGFSQAALFKLLDETWGHETYLQWLRHIQSEYTRRRNALLDACEAYLPKEVVSWVPPSAGMFLWLNLDHKKHPETANQDLESIEQEIFDNCIEGGVLCARGSWFMTETDKPLANLFFRATFAAASEENMVKAVERLGAAIRKSYKL